VALRWIIEKGAVPIPGAKNAAQAEQNAGALGWALDPDDAAAIDRVALEGTRSLANRVWQHG
jgi:pyridoxine 4-dehydrogenase